MGHSLGMHAANQAEIVHAIRHVRKQLGYRLAALTMLLEFPRRFEDVFPGSFSCAGYKKLNLLIVSAIQFQLGVEGINLTGAALHKDKDDPFGFRDHTRSALGTGLRFVRIEVTTEMGSEDAIQSYGTKAASGSA